MEHDKNFLNSAKRFMLGKSRDLKDPAIFHKITLTAFLAWVGLGADGLSSSAYGPEEAFLTLGTHHFLSVFVAIGTVLTVLIISSSYSQIIELFPSGGGGYLVASKLLSPKIGMISGCALLIDYVLTITISVASGADALFSFFPTEFLYYKFYFALFGVLLLIFMNMRGVKESVLPLVPIFLIFIATHIFAILYSFAVHLFQFGDLVTSTSSDIATSSNELGIFGMLFLIVKAYTMGAGTYTGIEAVSNGVPILRDPKVDTAKKTMKYMAVSLSFMIVGLLLSYLFYGVTHEHGKTLNAVLYSKISSDWGTYGTIFLFLILFSEAIILFVAAQAGFMDGPRVLANMALDRWFPSRFAILSDRLVTQNGVIIMGSAAMVTMILSKGSVKFLIVLYSINVFATFFLSQLGMVRHWWQVRNENKNWFKKIAINGIGLSLTSLILVSVLAIKFFEGGWITLVITGSLISLAIITKKHYNSVHEKIKELDETILPAITESIEVMHGCDHTKPHFNPNDKTAIIFVNGFNGLGVHTLLSVLRTFPNTFSNFVFAQVGVVDTGSFKGTAELNELEVKTKKDIHNYIDFINRNGFYADGFSKVGTEIIETAEELIIAIQEKYSNTVFFGGQLVFHRETIFNKMLHNQIVFTLQKKLYKMGLPFVIMPIKINM
ncbi:MAG: APC family permease [Melioribacteraceae bacterium]